MLGQGLLLMVAGMGTVFVFLCIMIWIMMAVGGYYKANASRYQEEETPKKQPRKQSGADLHSVVAAIAVSLQQSGK